MSGRRVLVVGDIIVDRYVRFVGERTAAELRGQRVWDQKSEELRLGGAANVAANLASLSSAVDGPDVFLAGLVGVTALPLLDWERLRGDGLAKLNPSLVSFCDQELVKTRFVDENERIVARHDNRRAVDDRRSMEWMAFWESQVVPRLDEFCAVVLSDYAGGVITDVVATQLCSQRARFIVVDSKRRDLSCFRGATVLKLNESEYAAQTPRPEYQAVEAIADSCVVTRGSRGASLSRYQPLGDGRYRVDSVGFPGVAALEVDMTGCGDTFVAALVHYLTSLATDIEGAIRFANFCASRVVSLFGTTVLKPENRLTVRSENSEKLSMR